ncbi:MAG: hypothetical protein MI867_14995 [Pseudomonadales bacterium]|nr:hypothetical protein [Pseudomonadales bacterium]
MTDYVELLKSLKASLDSAASNQEFHRLIDLDSAVRACVNEAIEASQKDEKLKRDIAGVIREIMPVYRNIALVCGERSQLLKTEMTQLKRSRKGATEYLSVYGKMG